MRHKPNFRYTARGRPHNLAAPPQLRGKLGLLFRSSRFWKCLPWFKCLIARGVVVSRCRVRHHYTGRGQTASGHSGASLLIALRRTFLIFIFFNFERQAQATEQFPRFVVAVAGNHDGHVHALHAREFIGIEFRKHQLLRQDPGCSCPGHRTNSDPSRGSRAREAVRAKSGDRGIRTSVRHAASLCSRFAILPAA